MKQVYRLIDRYNLLTNCQNSEQKEFLEDLPVSLAYEISGKSAEATPAKAQAKAEVLAGDIATLKEYRERIKELERKAEQAEREAEYITSKGETKKPYQERIFFVYINRRARRENGFLIFYWNMYAINAFSYFKRWRKAEQTRYIIGASSAVITIRANNGADVKAV